MARTGIKSRTSDSTERPTKRGRREQATNATQVHRGQPKKVNVFISYARTDGQIAKALYEEITDINRERIHCFLDSQAIESGQGWETKLEDEIKDADWLVCIYTGEQSEFCGYEIGVFTGGMALRKGVRDSRLVCLHDVPNYPTVFRLHQNRFVDFPPERTSSSQTFDETSFYEHCEIAQFFFDLCNYDDLYVPREQEALKRKTDTIIRKAKRITEAFRTARGNDVRADTPTQLGIEVSVPQKIGESLASIPLDAQVKGTFQSFKLFGLMPPMQGEVLPASTWGEIKAVRSDANSGYLPWIDRLEKDMLSAANGRALSQPEATLRSSDAKTYRAILIRHVLHWDGCQRFFIVFVETLPRQFVGDKNTSLILAGLVIASRFRFHYLEEPERIDALFDDKLSDREFEANYRQFHYDLERFRQEAMELGLLDEIAFIQSFGEERKEIAASFVKVSTEARQTLESNLPEATAAISKESRPGIRQAVLTFLKTMRGENSRFLRVAIEAYRDELAKQLPIMKVD